MWLGQKEKCPQFFCEKHMISPLILSRKLSKSTVLKTPKIHKELLRCAIQLFLTDNSDNLLRCVKIINTCERVSEQICRTKIVTLLLLFWCYLKKKLPKPHRITDLLRLLLSGASLSCSRLVSIAPIFSEVTKNITSKSDSDHNGNTNLKNSTAIS